MRVAIRVLVGIAVLGGLLAVNVLCSGCVAAAALLFAYFAAVVAVGLIVAAILDYRENRTMRRGPVRHFTGHCHECGNEMLQVGPVWICATCDRAPTHRVIGRRRR